MRKTFRRKAVPFRIACEGKADLVVGPEGVEARFTGRDRMKRAVEFAAGAIVGYELGRRSRRKR